MWRHVINDNTHRYTGANASTHTQRRNETIGT